MKQTRCSLCEGRIADGRCQECGMYYRQIQGRYYLNENRNNGETGRQNKYSEKTEEYSPKTAARTESTVRKSEAQKTRNRNGMEPVRRERPVRRTSHQSGEGKSKVTAGTIIYFIVVLVIAGVTLLNRIGKEKYEQYGEFVESADEPASVDADQLVEEAVEEETDAEDIYEWVQAEIPEEGSEFGIDLTAGRYVVGRHLPEGIYRLEASEDVYAMYLNLQDEENFIYHTWWMEDYVTEENLYEVEDIRLYNGAVLTVRGPGAVSLQTSNAQMDEMQAAEQNPLTEEIQVTSQTMTAGEDFPAGVYDAELRKGSGTLMVVDEEDIHDRYYFSLSEHYDSQTFRNLVLTPGMQVYQEDYKEGETVLKLVPSKEIFSDGTEED